MNTTGGVNTSTAPICPLHAGAAELDITPTGSVFLYGYPHVERYSTGVHDPLLCSALCLDDGAHRAVLIASDLIWLPKAMIDRCRDRIAGTLNIPTAHVLVTASHTHSGPVTVRMLSNEADPAVPEPDPGYLDCVEAAIVEAATRAATDLRPARLEYAVADGRPLGTNRRDPNGPAIPDVPVFAARDAADDSLIALMAVVSMHPTVLHEDSTLISGDFPGLARRHLKADLLGPDRPFVYHMGASGNQSPRHVTRGNTPAEADRLGRALSDAIQAALRSARPLEPRLAIEEDEVRLPLRRLPSVREAMQRTSAAKRRLNQLQDRGADRAAIRTAEVDWFGAEETLTLARAAEVGRVEAVAESCLPARVQLLDIGGVRLLAWPGEVFVEFALEAAADHDATHVITLANGELQGYLVTRQAVSEGAYEAGNALFASPESGRILVEASRRLLARMGAPEGTRV